MAEEKAKGKKKEENEIVLERVYNVPLRKEWLKAPKYKRTKKAVTALREFIMKHMKSDNVKINKFVNLELWKHGIKNPPHHIKIKAIKHKDDSVMVELEGVKTKDRVPSILRKARAKELKKPKAPKEGEKDPMTQKLEEAKEDQKEEAKAVEKEELKEIKKEESEVLKKPEEVDIKEFKSEKADTKAPKGQQGVARSEHRDKAEKKE